MHVAYLSLRDFRCYSAVELALEPGVTAFVGPNGAGKTNLLEALAYLATLGSHRAGGDGPLVRAGTQRGVVRASISDGGRTTVAELEINPGRANRARLNRSPLPRARELLGTLRMVLFSPDDLALVKGDPSERRRFLDDTLVAGAPRLAGVRGDYERVLKQRNALLKSASGLSRGQRRRQGGDVTETLDVWDSHLASAGAELLAARLELVRELRPLLRQAYRDVASASAPVDLSYRSSLQDREGGGVRDREHGGRVGGSGEAADASGVDDTAEPEPDRTALAGALRDKLAENRSAELERGVSLVGPHRDDVALALGGLPARGYASHGESWSLALALRLAAYGLLRRQGTDPVLLLDDVFAELDPTRRERLASLVDSAEQVLVTAAYAGDIPEALAGTRLRVVDGEVRGDG